MGAKGYQTLVNESRSSIAYREKRERKGTTKKDLQRRKNRFWKSRSKKNQSSTRGGIARKQEPLILRTPAGKGGRQASP